MKFEDVIYDFHGKRKRKRLFSGEFDLNHLSLILGSTGSPTEAQGPNFSFMYAEMERMRLCRILSIFF